MTKEIIPSWVPIRGIKGRKGKLDVMQRNKSISETPCRVKVGLIEFKREPLKKNNHKNESSQGKQHRENQRGKTKKCTQSRKRHEFPADTQNLPPNDRAMEEMSLLFMSQRPFMFHLRKLVMTTSEIKHSDTQQRQNIEQLALPPEAEALPETLPLDAAKGTTSVGPPAAAEALFPETPLLDSWRDDISRPSSRSIISRNTFTGHNRRENIRGPTGSSKNNTTSTNSLTRGATRSRGRR